MNTYTQGCMKYTNYFISDIDKYVQDLWNYYISTLRMDYIYL